MKFSAAFVLLILVVGCKQNTLPKNKEKFKPNLMAVSVQNIDRSLQWYSKLGFKVEREIKEYPDYNLKLAFLKVDDFHLEIIEMKDAIKKNMVLNNQKSLGEISKMGVVVADLETAYENLQQSGDINFMTEIGDLPANKLLVKWPTQHFLLKDPDGNLIQCFNSGLHQNISPWLIMITVKNLKSSILWYTKNLGFTHLDTFGNQGNKRAILERNNYVLELFQPDSIISLNELKSDNDFLGFKKIGFMINDISKFDAIFKKENTKILTPITKSDLEWASKTMIVTDPEGNWIQLFE